MHTPLQPICANTVLLDRDGTLVYDKHYASRPEEMELLPKTVQGLHRLKENVAFFMVTNQSGVGRGYFTEEAMNACNNKVCEDLKQHDVIIKDTASCPHAPEDNCQCRKPATGLWEQLKNKHGLDSKQCIMIGDKQEDILFARNCQMKIAILVLTGKGTEVAKKLELPQKLTCSSQSCGTIAIPKELLAENPHFPDAVSANLNTAADWILNNCMGASGALCE